MSDEKIKCRHCGRLIVRCEDRHEYGEPCSGWRHKAHRLFGHGCGTRDRNMTVAFPPPQERK
jgi:hypothetical protein